MSTIITQKSHSFDSIIIQGIKTILEEKTLIYPTETCYGIGGNALSQKVISKIREIKGKETPLSILVANLKEAEKYCYLDEAAKILVKNLCLEK